MNLRKKSTREEFERALAQCKPEDFDGHTEFHRLTSEQRLEWLCEAATFARKKRHRAETRTADGEIARVVLQNLYPDQNTDSCE